MITVAEINDIDQIDNFRLSWHALLAKTKGATFAHSPEWLELYWQHFGDGLKLKVLFVTLGNKIIGVVPLVVKPVSTKVGTLRVLTFPLDGWGGFFSQIGANPAATMVTAMRHLNSSKRDWDLIDLRYIDHDGQDKKRTSNAMKSVGFQGSQTIWKPISSVNTRDLNWDNYFASRTSKTQQLINLAEQTTTQAGHVNFYRSQMEDPSAPGWSPRWDLWTEFEQMDFTFENEKTIAGGCFATDKKLAFLRDVHGPAVRSGRARIDALFINHSLVACAYGLQHATGTDYIALGHKKDTPQEVVPALISKMIQQSIQEGEHSLNLSLLNPQIANLWKNEEKTSYRCSHFPITVPRSQLLRMNRWLQQPTQKQKSSRNTISEKSALKTKSSRDSDSTIEITNEAPQDWPTDKDSRSKNDRHPFRVVG